MTEIERCVPVPEHRTGRPPKYPWADMAVGDSFRAHGVTINGLRSTASYHAGKLGRGFRVRAEGDGLRVWRVA